MSNPPDPPGGPSGPDVPPEPERNGLSFGAGIAIGVGIGVGAHILGVFLMLATLGIGNGSPVFLWPFIVIVLVGVALMFARKTRGFGTGMLIVSAASWIILIGPCLALIYGM